MSDKEKYLVPELVQPDRALGTFRGTDPEMFVELNRSTQEIWEAKQFLKSVAWG